MSHDPDDSWDEDSWDDGPSDETLPCPECGADVYADLESCPTCGYWFTEADRTRAWRAGSTTGRILQIGWWILATAFIGWLLLTWG